MGHSKGSPNREVHSNTGLPSKDRNISNKERNPMPTRTQGTTTKTAQSKYCLLYTSDVADELMRV